MEPVRVPETDEELLAECDVDTFRSSGKGGQSVNTTDSAVRLRHRPTGLTVISRTHRSQLLNKRSCLRVLRARLTALATVPEERIPTRTPRSAHARRVATKVRHSRLKRLRGPLDASED